VTQQIWPARSDPVPLLSGVDARLIEAEAKLQANDIAGMTAILNSLRAAPHVLGALTSPVMSALAAPATKDAAVTLYFRETAFWQFSRGTRLPNLRRLVRQYGRTQDKVFPTGQFFKGQTYQNDVNFRSPPVSSRIRTSPAASTATPRSHSTAVHPPYREESRMNLAGYARSIRRALVGALSLIVPGAISAQGTITGRVTASGSNAPVAAARVIAVGTNSSAMTGLDGNYTLRHVPLGPNMLQVLHVGFQTQKKPVTLAGAEKWHGQLRAGIVRRREARRGRYDGNGRATRCRAGEHDDIAQRHRRTNGELGQYSRSVICSCKKRRA
jgi:hypothetical protein